MCGIAAIVGEAPGIPGIGSLIIPTLLRRGPDVQSSQTIMPLVKLFGAVLHLRGIDGQATVQPLVCPESGDMLCWNGQVFGGSLTIASHENDTQIVLRSLVTACSAVSAGCPSNNVAQCVSQVLAEIEGPFSFIFWSQLHSILFFGRDRLGRRSLLRLRGPPNLLVLSSVAPAPITNFSWTWEEISSSSFFSARVGLTTMEPCEEHAWPIKTGVGLLGSKIETFEEAVNALLEALNEAVRRMVVNVPVPPFASDLEKENGSADALNSSPIPSRGQVGVLFSGGIDSVILALLADHHLPPGQPIELINVAFSAAHMENEGTKGAGVAATTTKKRQRSMSSVEAVAPDRAAALVAIEELRALAPSRPWRLVAVDVPYGEVVAHRPHIVACAAPASTHMDFNIAAALWFAARGVGQLLQLPSHGKNETCPAYTSASDSESCLMRAGADQCPSAAPLLRYANARASSNGRVSSELEVSPASEASSVGRCASTGCRGLSMEGCVRHACGRCCRRTSRLTAQLLQHVALRLQPHIGSAKSTVIEEPYLVDTKEDMSKGCVGGGGQQRKGKKRALDAQALAAQLLREGLLPLDAAASHLDIAERYPHGAVPCGPHDGAVAVAASAAATAAAATAAAAAAVVADADSAATVIVSHSSEACDVCDAGEEKVWDIAPIGEVESTPVQSGDRLLGQTTVERAEAVAYTCSSRVLLSGSGADEQMAGYSRHRGAWARGGWPGLRSELDMEVARIGIRNLGRDDRVVSDHGRELRCPYLDEPVMQLLKDIPLHFIADLDAPPGIGDKRILRAVACRLGLTRTQSLVKRAIQFGSRIAKLSNEEHFGANRKGQGSYVHDYNNDE